VTLADNEADLVFLLFRHDGEKGMGGGGSVETRSAP